MAIGPLEREALRQRVSEQYKEKSLPVLLAGLDLALRGFELSRRRLDKNALDWDQYLPLRGHYNATTHGILDALNGRGLTPQAAQMWKKTHSQYWNELEEPAFMTEYCKEIFQKMIPHIVAAHSSLKALNNMLILLKEKGSDPKSAAIIRSSIEANTLGMNKAGFGIEVRALRGIYGFDPNNDHLWMEKYIQKLSTPVAVVVSSARPPAPVDSSRKKGLQKCTPSSDFYNDAPSASEPIGEPWEEAIGTLPGAIPSSKPFTAPVQHVQKPKGLHKCTPDDITDDSFGM